MQFFLLVIFGFGWKYPLSLVMFIHFSQFYKWRLILVNKNNILVEIVQN